MRWRAASLSVCLLTRVVVGGYDSDSVPIFGYRRRSYLFVSGLTGALGWVGMATLVDEPRLALAMLTLGSLGTAVSDVVVDSIVVERARGEGQTASGRLQVRTPARTSCTTHDASPLS